MNLISFKDMCRLVECDNIDFHSTKSQKIMYFSEEVPTYEVRKTVLSKWGNFLRHKFKTFYANKTVFERFQNTIFTLKIDKCLERKQQRGDHCYD